MRLIFPGGAREEQPDEHGLANFFQRVWASGSPSYTSLQIAETLESLGASVSAFSGRNTFGIGLEGGDRWRGKLYQQP